MLKYNKEFFCNFINDLHNKLKEKLNLESTEKILLNEFIFKKDNISNSQYDFIYSCTNLRAYN